MLFDSNSKYPVINGMLLLSRFSRLRGGVSGNINTFICKVLQIMCALVQNKLYCLKSAFSEFYCSTSEAVPTITGYERQGHVVSCCTHGSKLTVDLECSHPGLVYS